MGLWVPVGLVCERGEDEQANWHPSEQRNRRDSVGSILETRQKKVGSGTRTYGAEALRNEFNFTKDQAEVKEHKAEEDYITRCV